MKALFFSTIIIAFSIHAEQPQFPAEDISFFEKNIRPLLKDKCYRCHSHTVSTKKKLKGNLFLDSRVDIIQGGNNGPAALPGKTDESLIIKYVTHEDIDERMPPKEKDWLSEKEISNLKIWISKGMPWPKEPRPKGAEGFRDLFDIAKRKSQHWAWNALEPPKLPKNSQNHPLDKFIEAKLAKNKLSFSAEADKRTLIRRAYLDLIGLLPNKENVEAFVNDQSEDAFTKVIDDLLSKKTFGERWARHWLDLVRYAESHGHEFDYSIPHAYKYRDMVIRAFNKDVPHDQWLKEHVAGDLLKSPRIDPETGMNESITATGFWYLYEATHAPVDVKEDEALRLNNQIDTFSKSFLALTVACARCHDHKFDAITAKDFYALSGYLQSSRRQEAMLDPKGKISRSINKIDNLKSSIEKILIESYSEMEKYLTTAAKIFSYNPTDYKVGSAQIFADFENGYGDWKTEGDAFGDRPVSNKYRTHHLVTNISKDHYVCSYHPFKLNGKNPDNRTGKLISPKFTVKNKQISFLVAGGSHKNQTCVNLVIDNKVVKTQSGFNNRDLREIRWNVSEYMNKQARIEIVDKRKGGWGHITADRFIFSDSEILFTKTDLDEAIKKNGLQKDLLISWLSELKIAYKSPDHPLHIIARSTTIPLQNLKSEQNAFKALNDQFESSTTLFDDFSENDYSNVKISGQAFPREATPGYINSAHYGKQFHGVVRTRDFTINGPHIFLKIAGKSSLVRVIIEDYFLDTENALLFKGLAKKINTDSSSASWFRIDGDLKNYIGRRAHLEFIDHGDGYFRIEEIRFGDSDIPDKDFDEFNYQMTFAKDANELLQKTISSVKFQKWLNDNPSLVNNPEIKKLSEKIRETAQSAPNPEKVLAIEDGFPLDNYVYDRGSHEKKGIDAPRAFLEAFSGPTQSVTSEGSGRLQLAEKILRDARHFLARVQVNRIWLHLMGSGIVPTPDDFGVLGMKPTHSELLDHLALKFIEFDWSNKKMIKYIMSSKTYRQSSNTSDLKKENVDPDNTLYHRANIRRLEGEIIRDITLQVSGKLNDKMFGPPVPIHLTRFMTGRGRPKGGPVDGDGRRSIYLAVRRNFLSPFFLTFDFPIPAQSIGKRNSTNVPAQALSLLNDPFIHQQTDILTNKLLDELKSKDKSTILNDLYLKFFSRKPKVKESLLLKPLLNDRDSIKKLVHILLNTKEFSHVF